MSTTSNGDTTGSPPRVRGKDSCRTPRHSARRITPACAGKSFSQGNEKPETQDHPRVCGEKELCLFSTGCSVGSPPRVRGKAGNLVAKGLNLGITPACAGKSVALLIKVFLGGDHPRVCGEKALGDVKRNYKLGSPPRVRGKVMGDFKSTAKERITPACAGKRLKKALKNKDF